MINKNGLASIILSGLNLVLLTGISNSCAFKIQKHFVRPDDVIKREKENQQTSSSSCMAYKHYQPNPDRPGDIPVRHVRVNFHIIKHPNKDVHFDSVAGVSYVKKLIKFANADLADNSKMVLPKGNNTPVLPTRTRYILAGKKNQPNDDGIYFHEHEQLWKYVKKGKDKNQFSKRPYSKYGIRKGEVINVFLHEHPPDSVNSPTYKASKDGVGYGGYVKLVGNYQHLDKEKITNTGEIEARAYIFENLLNHELGHSFGLSHTWNMNDGCDDTPQNAGCWASNGEPPCDKEYTSNNVMDYNHMQDAYTPCQIGKIQKNFAQLGSPQREKLKPNWCTYKADSTVFIGAFEDVVWKGHRDLEGDIIINNQGSLTIRCRVHLPEDAKIMVKPKAELVLDGGRITNLCGDKWQGIEVWENKRNEPVITFKNDAMLEDVSRPLESEEDKGASQ